MRIPMIAVGHVGRKSTAGLFDFGDARVYLDRDGRIALSIDDVMQIRGLGVAKSRGRLEAIDWAMPHLRSRIVLQ